VRSIELKRMAVTPQPTETRPAIARSVTPAVRTVLRPVHQVTAAKNMPGSASRPSFAKLVSRRYKNEAAQPQVELAHAARQQAAHAAPLPPNPRSDAANGTTAVHADTPQADLFRAFEAAYGNSASANPDVPDIHWTLPGRKSAKEGHHHSAQNGSVPAKPVAPHRIGQPASINGFAPNPPSGLGPVQRMPNGNGEPPHVSHDNGGGRDTIRTVRVGQSEPSGRGRGETFEEPEEKMSATSMSGSDLEFLAEKVFQILRRRLTVERERHGRPGLSQWR
jgi:hypothetical protein